MRRAIAISFVAIGAIWGAINFIGNLQTAKGLYDDRGRIVNAVVEFTTKSPPLVPALVFIVGVAALIGLKAGWFDRTVTPPAESLHSHLMGEVNPSEESEPSDQVVPRPDWICGIYDYPPLSSWPDSKGGPSGPLVWMAERISQYVGKTATYARFAYDDFYRGDKHIPDMVVGMFETKRRSCRVVFSRSIYEIGLQGICRKEQQGDVLQGLRDGTLRVAVYSGEVGWEFVQDELTDAVEEHRVATLVGGRQMHTMSLLTEGFYDVVIMDYLSCFNFLAEADNRQQFKLAFEEPPQKYRACLALKKEHSNRLAAIDRAIIELRNTREFLQIEEQALTGFERIIDRRGLRSRRSNRNEVG